MSLQGVCIAVCSVVKVKHLIVSFRTDFRSSYIMNSTIAGIEVSDTVLIQSNLIQLLKASGINSTIAKFCLFHKRIVEHNRPH